MRKCRRRILISILLFSILIVVAPAGATTISDIKKENKETEKQLDAVNDSIKDLEETYAQLESELGELDARLVELLASVSVIEEEVTKMEEDKALLQEEYDIAVTDEQQQYEDMKTRIRILYEKGESGFFEFLFSGESITSILNKVNYVQMLYDYDRESLVTYQNTVQIVAQKQEELEIQSAELTETMHAYEEEQAALEVLMLAKEATCEDYDSQIAQAQQLANQYKSKIKEQTKEIERLEEIEAEKAAAEAAANHGGSNPSQVVTSATGSELGKEIANYGLQFVGNPYVYGGTSLTNGCDCSGFTQSVYAAFGYAIPRTSTSQRSAGVGVSYSAAQPGDLICYSGHVALYIGGGQIVHASTEKTGIIVGTATYRSILAVRRIIN